MWLSLRGFPKKVPVSPCSTGWTRALRENVSVLMLEWSEDEDVAWMLLTLPFQIPISSRGRGMCISRRMPKRLVPPDGRE